MTDDSAAALRGTAARLWPPPATVAVRRSRRVAAAGQRVVAEFGLLPSADRPRLALPLRPPGVAAAMLRRFSHDLSWSARTGRALAATFLGLPGVGALMAAALPHRLVVTGPPSTLDSLPAYVARALGLDRVVVGLGVGTARANRKPVLPVCSVDGELLAYVKAGDTPAAAALVRAEAEALRAFTTAGTPPGIEVPTVLHHGQHDGIEVLVLSAVRTTRRRWQPREAIPVRAMRTFGEHLGMRREPLAETPGWQAFRHALRELADDAHAATLAHAADAIETSLGDHDVEVGCWHGDWTAWNMSWDRDRVQLWDFERFATGMPLGLDYAHYRVQSALRTGGTEAADRLLADGLPADPIAHGANPIALVESAYLLMLAERYVRAAHPPEGAPLRPRRDWLVDLIARRWP